MDGTWGHTICSRSLFFFLLLLLSFLFFFLLYKYIYTHFTFLNELIKAFTTGLKGTEPRSRQGRCIWEVRRFGPETLAALVGI
jgi:hypothetical protein